MIQNEDIFKSLELKKIPLKHNLLSIDTYSKDDGRLTNILLKFSPLNENEIYKKSSGEVVNFLPENLSIKLNAKEFVEFNSLVIETISTYLFSLRKKILPGKNLIEVFKLKDSPYNIKIIVTKFFFREKEKGRYKMEIIFINKKTEEEVVSLRFTKKDMLIMHNLFKKIAERHQIVSGIYAYGEVISKDQEEEVLNEKIFMCGKYENTILINNTWLHNQEVIYVMYLTDKLINSLNVEENLQELRMKYRQIAAKESNGVIYLYVSKFIENEDSEENELIKIPLTSKILSIISLITDIQNLKKNKYEMLEEEHPFLEDIKGLKHVLNFKESVLGIKTAKRRKNPSQTKFVLVGKVKEGVFSVENEMGDFAENFMKTYENDQEITIPVLTEFQIDLRDNLKKMIKGFSSGLTKSYLDEERDFNSVKFYTIDSEFGGRVKYEFQLYSSPTNKAPIVMTISKYNLSGSQEKLTERYRQVFFEKQAYAFLYQLLSVSTEMNPYFETKEINTIDTLTYRYKSMSTVIRAKRNKVENFGIKKEGTIVEFGIFDEDNQKELYEKLEDKDILLLNLSCLSKILYGRFIPFTGDKIVISQDGYITDLHGEIKLKVEDSFESDLEYAIMFFIGASFNI